MREVPDGAGWGVQAAAENHVPAPLRLRRAADAHCSHYCTVPAGLLAECTVPDQCPWADVKRLPLPPGLPRNLWGSVRLVNRAPLMPSAGLAAFLSTHATAGARASALDLVAALANSSLTQVCALTSSSGAGVPSVRNALWHGPL